LISYPQWGIWHSLSDRGVRYLLLSGTVRHAGPLWGGEASDASRIARSGASGSLGCVVAGSWHSVASWGYLWSSKASGLESSGSHKASRPWGSTCVGAWVSRSHRSCFSLGRTKPVGSSSGVQFATWASVNAVPWYFCWLRRIKLLGSGSSAAWFHTLAFGSTILQHCCSFSRAKPMDSRVLGFYFLHGLQGVPSVTLREAGALGPAYTGGPISLTFQGEGSG
jgi:hypothetical protein